MNPTGIDYLVQFGGLGIAAYLIWWLTRKLNGKLDRLTDAVRETTHAVKENADAVKKLTATMEFKRYEERANRDS